MSNQPTTTANNLAELVANACLRWQAEELAGTNPSELPTREDYLKCASWWLAGVDMSAVLGRIPAERVADIVAGNGIVAGCSKDAIEGFEAAVCEFLEAQEEGENAVNGARLLKAYLDLGHDVEIQAQDWAEEQLNDALGALNREVDITDLGGGYALLALAADIAWGLFQYLAYSMAKRIEAEW